MKNVGTRANFFQNGSKAATFSPWRIFHRENFLEAETTAAFSEAFTNTEMRCKFTLLLFCSFTLLLFYSFALLLDNSDEFATHQIHSSEDSLIE